MGTEVTKQEVTRIETPFDIAHQNFRAWNDALQSKDPETVANLYTEDAAFLPTLEATKSGRGGAQEYFVHFLEKSPFGTIVQGTDTAQHLSDDTIVHSGLYDFELGPESDRSVAHARFTFVWTRHGRRVEDLTPPFVCGAAIDSRTNSRIFKALAS